MFYTRYLPSFGFGWHVGVGQVSRATLYSTPTVASIPLLSISLGTAALVGADSVDAVVGADMLAGGALVHVSARAPVWVQNVARATGTLVRAFRILTRELTW